MVARSVQHPSLQIQEEFKSILYRSSDILDEGTSAAEKTYYARSSFLCVLLQMMTWWFTTFMAPAIKQKVHSLPGVEYLYSVMSRDQLEIPAYITEYDMSVSRKPKVLSFYGLFYMFGSTYQFFWEVDITIGFLSKSIQKHYLQNKVTL